jgi:hypothetical protein
MDDWANFHNQTGDAHKEDKSNFFGTREACDVEVVDKHSSWSLDQVSMLTVAERE